MASVSFKAIPIGSSKIFNVSATKAAMTTLLNQEVRLAQTQFKRTTATWNKKPVFSIVSVSTYIKRVVTSDKIYSYINFGTDAHIIVPRNAPVLKFKAPYVARTSPGSISSGQSSAGPTPVVAMEVHHPGTKPRNFDEVIARMHSYYFADEVVRLVIGAIQ